MSSCSRRPKPSLKRGESSLPMEDWQLRILWEWQQKQPHPSLEQRKLLATQTGLNTKWISSWFKKVNGVSKKKNGAAAKGTPSGASIVAAASHGFGSPKLAVLAETILPSSTGMPPSAAEDRFTFYPEREDVRSSISQKKHSSTRELSGAAMDLILVPDSDLQTNRDHLVLCSSSHGGARLVQVSESPSALLHPQRTGLGYDFASSSLQHGVSSPGSLRLSGSQHPGSCGSHTLHEASVQTHHYHAILGGSQSVVPAYPKYTAHDLRSASAYMHPESSVPTSVPLPSIYWLLFDRDERSIGGRNDGTIRGTPFSPPGEVGGPGVAATPQVGATPVSFLAKWEDLLVLERSVRSSFVKGSSRARQAQSSEVTPIEQGGLGISLTNSEEEHNAPTYPRRVQSSSSTDE